MAVSETSEARAVGPVTQGHKLYQPLGERPRRHTEPMGEPLPHVAPGPPAAPSGDIDAALVERLTRLLGGAVDVWGSPSERRRMRLFGFRPAVEDGVLKREWYGLRVRAAAGCLSVTDESGRALTYTSDDGVVRIDGEPLRADKKALAIAEPLVGLVESYERWVEAREGRDERLRRGRAASRDTRPVNALAETRRLRRIFTQARAR